MFLRQDSVMFDSGRRQDFEYIERHADERSRRLS